METKKIHDDNLYLVRFDDYRRALEYARNNQIFENILVEGGADILSLAGMSPETIYVFGALRGVLYVFCFVISAIAVIVIILNSVRLMEYEKKNIQLYKTLGATPKQVCLTYLVYFLILICGSTAIAIVLAIGTDMLFSLVYQNLLSTTFMMALGLSNEYCKIGRAHV